MLHPIFSILIQRPELVIEHLSGYSALLQTEATQAAGMLVKRYVAAALAAVCGVVFVLFAGVALMLGALYNQLHWMLLAVPGTALFAMLIAIIKAKAPSAKPQFTELKAQIQNDIQALKAVA